MRDMAFKQKELERWQNLFPHAWVECLKTAGHFLQDEEGPVVSEILKTFLDEQSHLTEE
jgi:hypothetical protein